MLSDKSMEELSPFELNLFLEKKLQTTSHNNLKLLNAGRGNPNWTASTPREAFFLLGQFATQETMASQTGLMARMIEPSPGRFERFIDFLTKQPGKGTKFLKTILLDNPDYLGLDSHDWLDKILDYIIGDNYPSPVRCLNGCEQPIKAYLNESLFANQTEAFDIFAVEGGTAGICYLFDTLLTNHLLNQNDRIALLLPTFAPYLEIMDLPRYQFDVVEIKAEATIFEGKISYQYSKEEIDKLKDDSIKAVFIVNPSNPTANAMCQETIDQMKQIVSEDNPNLMVLTDDVYGTFVEGFQSLFAELPYNTACIYSYSKYFGSTGWRIGTIAVAKENVFDRLLKELPLTQKMILQKRYSALHPRIDEILFIDRLVADSRSVVLNHAAGLSSVQQVMMTLFSLYGLSDEGNDYKVEVMSICHIREKLLLDMLEIDELFPALNTAYYVEVDVSDWLEKRFGADFSAYLTNRWTITKVLTLLAEKERLMLLKSDAFGSKPWAIRISLANLDTDDYLEVGKRILRLSEYLKEDWLAYKKRQQIS